MKQISSPSLGLLNTKYLQIVNNLSDVADAATSRTNLGLVAGGAGDIWVEKAGDTMTGQLLIEPSSDVNNLVLKLYDGQTANPFELQDKDGNILVTFNVNGSAVFNEYGSNANVRIETANEQNAFYTDGGNDLIYIGGSTEASADILFSTTGRAHFNLRGNDENFQVEGDTNEYLIFGDAGNDAVAIGTQTIKTGSMLTVAGHLSLTSQNEIRFYDNGNYVGFEAPALAADQIWVLPDADGGAGELLKTDGAGNLDWVAPSGSPGGADTEIQYNDGGAAFGGISTFTWDDTTVTLVSPDDEPTLGAEEVTLGDFASDPSGDWTIGANWAWDNTNYEMDHTTGDTATLVQAISLTNNYYYYVEFEIKNRTAGSLVASMSGHVESKTGYSNGVYALSFQALSTASYDLTFTPSSTWNGSLDNVSMKRVSAAVSPAFTLEDTGNNANFSFRTPGTNDGNMCISNTGGQYTYKSANVTTTSSQANLFIGANAGLDNITGYGNVYIGSACGRYSTHGYENTFVGESCGGYHGNVNTGYRNVGVGYRALYYNTTGRLNVGLGYLAGQGITTGTENMCIGQSAGSGTSTGAANVAIGSLALVDNDTGIGNIALGQRSIENITPSVGQNIGIGAWCYYSCSANVNYNVIVGDRAGRDKTDGSRNVLIGNRAGYDAGAGDDCVFIGYKAGHNETSDERLYIANDDTATPLIYGEFDNALLKIHGDLQLQDAKNLIFDTTTGTEIGTATTQKLAFWGATPIVQLAKASYNNWAAFTDIVDALVAVGLFDAA